MITDTEHDRVVTHGGNYYRLETRGLGGSRWYFYGPASRQGTLVTVDKTISALNLLWAVKNPNHNGDTPPMFPTDAA